MKTKPTVQQNKTLSIEEEYELLPDSAFDDSDDYVEDAQMRQDIAEALKEVEAYRHGEKPLRATELVDGKPVTYWRYQDGPVVDKYRVIIEWNRAKAVFVAILPELPNCQAEGKTQEEALTHVRNIANLWLDTAMQEGRDIPLPSSLFAAA